MAITKFDTPEMLASTMERQHHRANLFQSIFSTGGMAGNNDLVILDISYWQDHRLINYDELCKHIAGVILRVTYGIWEDTRFKIHYDEFAKRNIPIGGYAYLIGNQTALAQANAFHKAVESRPLKIGSVADIEDQRPATKLTRAVADGWIANTDRLMKDLTKIYTGPYAWRAIMGYNYTVHRHRKLWIANYQVNKPMMPLGGGWGTSDWWLWQHTDKGTLPGYRSSLDLNRYNGTTQQWLEEVGMVEKPPVPALTLEERMDRVEKHLGIA